MKGLLIAYAFSPQKSVGALRPTYWAEEIGNLSNIELDVITAIQSEAVDLSYKLYYVENKSTSIWSMFIKDEGLTWRKDVIKFLEVHGVEQYDFVLITGGPFFHFSITNFFKKFKIKVILDFRDPFSYNPRLKESILKRMIKQNFERNFLRCADLVITVNEACHEYIGPQMNLKRAVIPNGFDERLIKPGLKNVKTEFDFFYGGKFYWEPVHFFDTLESEKYMLCHAGNYQELEHNFTKKSSFHQLGMLSQKEMFLELAKAEITVVFTIDVPFESTTKIYDYLALGKKILIITKGEPYMGALKRELDGYPTYKWVRDDPSEISQAIQELKAMKNVNIDMDQFSRQTSLLLLISEIEKLVNV